MAAAPWPGELTSARRIQEGVSVYDAPMSGSTGLSTTSSP